MSKDPENNIYVAADMYYKKEGESYIVIDKRDNNAQLDPTNLDDKIKIYQREVEEWFLKPAKSLVRTSGDRFNNSLVVLMICMSYIEGVEQYKTGVSSDKQSKDLFRLSIIRMYPNESFSDSNINRLYSDSRCGLFHNGMVKAGVRFSDDYEKAIEFQNGGNIRINPRQLLKDVVADFDKYILELNNITDPDSVARQNFDRMFKLAPKL